jgi:uncharacterized membrane protein YbhN (UPF0104 family)
LTRQRLLQIVKWVWVVLVIGGALYYLFRHYKDVVDYLRLISAANIISSVLLLFAGKLLLAQLSRNSLHGQPWQPSFSQMLYYNSITQLAKYLPGGIWHFVGRFGIYQNKGLTPTQSGRAILVENIWLVLSAVFFGAITGLKYFLGWMKIQIDLLSTAGWIALVLIIWFAAFWLVDRFASLQRHSHGWIFLNLILYQGVAWFMISLSFWVVLPNLGNNITLLGVTLGSFCISWAIGYVTPFAPGGLGVRETILALMLGLYISSSATLVYAAVNRLEWVIVEVLLGISCELAFGSGKLATLFNRGEPSP